MGSYNTIHYCSEIMTNIMKIYNNPPFGCLKYIIIIIYKANVKRYYPFRSVEYIIIATTQPTTQNNLKQFLLGWSYNR